MQIPKFNQTLQQLDNKEANKGLKRPVEDLFSDQELLLSQGKKHKRLKRSPDNQLSPPKFSQERDAWQISVPRDSDCLFMAVALAYLIPVKDNNNNFEERFKKLFYNDDSNKLEEIKNLVQSYDPFPGAKDIYSNKTLKKLIQQLRKKVVQHIRSNKGNFELGDNPDAYLSGMESSDWGSDVEVKAISEVLECKICGPSNSYGDGMPQLELFYDMAAARGSKDGNHYYFGLKRDVISGYVDQRLEEFVKNFVSVYERCLSEYDERLEKRMPKNGKWAEFLHKITEMGAGASELTAGRVAELDGGAIKAGVSVGLKFIDNVASGIGVSRNWKALKKLTQPIRMFRENRDEVIKLLVESGVGFFQRFESQFTRVTARDGTGWKGAMEKLAKDSVSRIISYYRANFEKEEEFSASLVTKGVILGESKRYTHVFLDIPRRKKGFNLELEDFKASTAGLFDKVGLVAKDPKRYYEKKDNSRKYGFRLLFQWEDQNLPKREVTVNGKQYTFLSKTPENKYEYLLEEKNLAEKQKEILDKIKNKKEDQKKDDDIAKMMQDFGEDFLDKLEKSIGDNFNDLLVEIGKNHEQIAEWFSEVKKDIEELGGKIKELESKTEELTDNVKKGFKELSGEALINHLDEATRLDIVNRIKINNEVKIKFEQEGKEFKDLISFIKSEESKFINVMADEYASLLTTAKIESVLRSNSGYVFVKLGSILTEDNSINIKLTKAFNMSNNPYYVLIMDCTEHNITEENIKELKLLNSLKKVVLITRQNNMASLFEKKDSQEESKIEYKDKVSFRDLTPWSQKEILKQEVLFQGNKIPLNKLISENDKEEDLEKIISAKDLSDLINKKDIVIGEALPDLGIVKDYYIDRKFNHQVRIKEDFFKEQQDDIFVINSKGPTLKNLKKEINNDNLVADYATEIEPSKRFFLLDGELGEKFNKLCKGLQEMQEKEKVEERNVHLLDLSDGKFTWKKSRGSLSNLRKYLADNVEPDKDKIDDDKVAIISAEPGMGKSIVLTDLAKKIKEESSELWVVRINLNDYTKDLPEVNFNNKDEAINFLLAITNLKAPLEKELFKYSFRQGKIALLFDGFDEINFDKQDNVIKLLKFLNNETQAKVEKILVTTRQHMQDRLENELSTFSYTLKPIDEKEQRKFLREFWTKSLELNVNNDKRFQNFVDALLEKFPEKDKRRFTDIPLHLGMVAEVVQNDFKSFYSSTDKTTKPEFSKKLDLLNLYKTFIEIKYNIYFDRYLKQELEDDKLKGIRGSSIKSLNKAHQNLALNFDILFPFTQQVKDLLRKEKSMTFSNKQLLDIGIVYEANDKPNFVHRTFAEYFAAELLVDMLDRPDGHPKHKIVRDFLRKQIFKKENEVIRNFFDRMLAHDKEGESEYEIHNAVLNNDKDKVEKLLSGLQKVETIINSLDKAGRTPLHLAAAYGYKEIVDVLLKHNPNVNINNELFGWSPLVYAAQEGSWNIAELLLKKGAKCGDLQKVQNFRSVDKKGVTLLHFAISHTSDTGTIKFIIDKEADVNAKDENNMTPLHLAAQDGYEEVIKALLKKGAIFDTKNMEGKTPLKLADGHEGIKNILTSTQGLFTTIKGGRLNESERVNKLEGYIKEGAIVNAKSEEAGESTPLHMAVKERKLELVEYLIEKGADLNSPDTFGQTPLLLAAYKGELHVVKLLIEKGANLNSSNKDGQTPLHLAAGNLDVVKLLIAKGADLNYLDKSGQTPLHLASVWSKVDFGEVARKPIELNVVKLLIEKGADFKSSAKSGQTPLHLAAALGNLDVAKYLVEKGAEFDAKDRKGKTPLELAERKEKIKNILILTQELFTIIKNDDLNENEKVNELKNCIEKGAIVNALSIEYNGTPLHSAIKSGYKEIVQLLLSNNANPNIKDKEEKTPLHLAAALGYLDVAKYLLEKGAEFDAKDRKGKTPLELAERKAKIENILTLTQELFTIIKNDDLNENEKVNELKNCIKKGAIVNALSIEYNGTPLHSATKSGYKEIVQLLLSNNANPNIKDKEGKTPLHLATQKGHKDTVEALLSGSANIDAKDNNGSTSLHLAAQNGYKEVVDALLSGGANITKDNNGQTSLHLAVKNGYDKVIKALIEYVKKTNLGELSNFINAKDDEQKTPLDLTEDSDIIDLLESHSRQQEVDPARQGGALSSLPLEKCLSSSSSERGSSGDRRKREAKAGECELSWEDVDEFNEEKEEVRDFSKIKINSDRFIDYIKSESMSETKLAQLVQLADKVQVTGKFQGLVNKLISNQKVMNHLNRVERVSGIAMHGMMGKAAVADFLNGDYTGVAINVGFIAGGQGFARVAQAASIKGTGLVLDGKLLLGRSLKAASPFLARGTSAFVVYDLVNQIKEFKNGTEEALVSVIGDGIYLGVDAVEIGIETAEAFEVFEGVSSITGPIGAAIGAVIFVGTDIYLAVKRVDKINEIIHLTGNERFIEGLRAFIGMQPKQYIEELMEEKQVNNQLVKQGLEYLQQHGDIQRYVFPTGKSVIDSCRDVPYKTSVCTSGGFGGGCSKTRTVTRYAEECTTKFQVDLDNKVLLNRKRTDIKWSRTKPDNSGELFCLPQGDYEQVPSSGAYLCNNTIGIETSSNKAGNYTFINLGEGNDDARGFISSPNIFSVSNGFKRLYGGNKDDLFVLQGNIITGHIDGGDGINTLDLSEFASKEKSMLVNLNREYIEHQGYGNNSFGVIQINKLLARKDKKDVIDCSCDTKYVNGQGGESSENDIITVPSSTDCFYKMQLVVKPNTSIYNHAVMGNFSYVVPTGSGKADVNLEASESRHDLFFNYTLLNAREINVNNIGYNITFSFSSTSEENTYDKFFNVTILPNANNTFYKLNDNTEIKVGKKNLYAVQGSDKPVDEIVNSYPAIANRLKMSLFVQSLLSNETVAIGHGNHDVLHNNPYYKSHLVGNGGENIFVVTSGYETLDNGKLPIPEVVIYDVDKENLIDTLDLRQIKHQMMKDLGKEIKARTSMSGQDLLIELFYPNSTKSLVTVRLKNALVTNWHERLQVILNDSPMKIEEFDLKPLPLVFSEDKEIVVITPKDVEEESKLVISKKAGDCAFARLGNDLIITNAFGHNLTNNELCTISLNNFYQEPKMQTLSIKFADKEISLKDEMDRINNASTLTEQLVRYKNDTYNTIFTTASNITDLHRRKRRDESEVEANNSNLLFHAQNDAIFTIKNNQATSGGNKLPSITDLHRRKRRDESTVRGHENNNDQALFYGQNNANSSLKGQQDTSGGNKLSSTNSGSRPSSWINDFVGWVKNSITGFLAPSTEQVSNIVQPEISNAFVDGFLILSDVGIRKFTGNKYKQPKHNSLLSPKELIEQRMDHTAINAINSFGKVCGNNNFQNATSKVYDKPMTCLSSISLEKAVINMDSKKGIL